MLIVLFVPLANCHLLEGLYCGKENCYDVLGITRETSKSEISKSYRRLAKVHHPDMHRDPEAKKEAEERFKMIATAYEILRDDESRSDYDYMLDNPSEYYAHYYRYYKRRVAPKVNVWLVIVVTISVISVIQYYSACQRYESAIKYFATEPKYRHKAMDMIQSDEVYKQRISSQKKERKKMSKSEQKEEMEQLIRTVIADKMDIKGGYAKPSIVDILWIQLLISPYTLIKYIFWYLNWIWRFNILKQPYGREQQLYLIRKNMGMGEHQFNAQEDTKIEEYLELELWDKELFKAWKEEQMEEMKKSLADNPRYKQYRRYMKNHGPGRLTFED